MGWNVLRNTFGHNWGQELGPDGMHMRQFNERRQSINIGFSPTRPMDDIDRGRHIQRLPSMAGPSHYQRRPSMSRFPQQQQHFGQSPRRPSRTGRDARGRSPGPQPRQHGPPIQDRDYPVRIVSPQRRSSMIEPGHRPRAKFARFDTKQNQLHSTIPYGGLSGRHSRAPGQEQFPFTVFGEGQRNAPDPTRQLRRSSMGGRGDYDGQHVGTNIMRKYVIAKPLKKGGMAEAVNIIRERSTGEVFVQKCLPLRRRVDYKRARAEINTLLKIDGCGRHENLNGIIESEISEARYQCFIILEYCDKGNLQDKIAALRSSGRNPFESAVWNVLAGVSNGLAFLHHGIINGRPLAATWDTICHLDLKPCNIFMSSNGGHHGHSRVVLADFGCAITRSDIVRHIENPFMPDCGTPGWYPPEGRNEGRTLIPYYGPKTDIWQLGATIQVFCKLIPGSQGPDRRSLETPRPCTARYSDRLNRVVAQLGQPHSEFRPCASELVVEAIDGFKQAVLVDKHMR